LLRLSVNEENMMLKRILSVAGTSVTVYAGDTFGGDGIRLSRPRRLVPFYPVAKS